MRGVGNALKTALLLGALSALILLIGRLLGGTTGLLIAGLVALGINGLSYFYSDKLALRAMRAQRVAERQAPQLHAIVADLVSRPGAADARGLHQSQLDTQRVRHWPEPLACGGLCHGRDPRRTGRAGVARGAGARDQPSAVVDLVLNATPGVIAGLLLGLKPAEVLALAGATWAFSAIIARLLGDLGRLRNSETPAILGCWCSKTSRWRSTCRCWLSWPPAGPGGKH